MKPQLLLLFCLLIFTACDSENTAKKEVTVFAAASLTDAFNELKSAFESRHEDIEVKLSFGASSTLATQIIEGADTDIFASANLDWIQKVRDEGELSGEPQLLAENRLIVVVYKDAPVQTLEAIAENGIKVVVAAPEVPIRVYTDTLLQSLNAEYGENFQASVMQNVVSEESNVRQVVLKVSLGEADAGIVYATDITPDIHDSVRVIDIPDAYGIKAQLYIGLTNNNPQAKAFMDFVLSADGQAILEKWGFLPVHG